MNYADSELKLIESICGEYKYSDMSIAWFFDGEYLWMKKNTTGQPLSVNTKIELFNVLRVWAGVKDNPNSNWKFTPHPEWFVLPADRMPFDDSVYRWLS